MGRQILVWLGDGFKPDGKLTRDGQPADGCHRCVRHLLSRVAGSAGSLAHWWTVVDLVSDSGLSVRVCCAEKTLCSVASRPAGART
eukprot:3913323-Prymnesium_polylepis.1